MTNAFVYCIFAVFFNHLNIINMKNKIEIESKMITLREQQRRVFSHQRAIFGTL